MIDHLNEVSGKSFRRETKATRSKVRTLLKAGYTREDITRVIDIKCSEWLDNPRMREYVRPKTLFAQENFESYHNQPASRPATRYGRVTSGDNTDFRAYD